MKPYLAACVIRASKDGLTLLIQNAADGQILWVPAKAVEVVK